MTAKYLVTGVAGVAAIGAAAAGLTAFAAGAAPTVMPVRQVVFDAPLAPAPPAPPTPAVPGEPVAPGAPAEPAATGAPLPTPEEVSGMLTRLSDAGIGYKEKGDLVENGISQQEGHGLDHELRKAYRDGELPYTFDVQNVVPTGPGQALATVTISGPKMPAPQTTPLQLVDQGSWVLSHDSATQLFQALAQH